MSRRVDGEEMVHSVLKVAGASLYRSWMSWRSAGTEELDTAGPGAAVDPEEEAPERGSRSWRLIADEESPDASPA